MRSSVSWRGRFYFTHAANSSSKKCNFVIVLTTIICSLMKSGCFPDHWAPLMVPAAVLYFHFKVSSIQGGVRAATLTAAARVKPTCVLVNQAPSEWRRGQPAVRDDSLELLLQHDVWTQEQRGIMGASARRRGCTRQGWRRTCSSEQRRPGLVLCLMIRLPRQPGFQRGNQGA